MCIRDRSYAGALSVSYQWDASNNLTKLIWPDGYDVDYVWGANNRVKQAKDGGIVLADVAYDAQSRRQAVAYSNGTYATSDYSDRGGLTDHNHGFVGGYLDTDFATQSSSLSLQGCVLPKE